MAEQAIPNVPNVPIPGVPLMIKMPVLVPAPVKFGRCNVTKFLIEYKEYMGLFGQREPADLLCGLSFFI